VIKIEAANLATDFGRQRQTAVATSSLPWATRSMSARRSRWDRLRQGRNQLGLLDQEAGLLRKLYPDGRRDQHGQLGGALVDAKAAWWESTAHLAPGRGNGNVGIGFAIPVNLAANVMQSLIATGTVTRGYLGWRTHRRSPMISPTSWASPRHQGRDRRRHHPRQPGREGGPQAEDVCSRSTALPCLRPRTCG